MSKKTVVIATSNGKVMEIVGNFNGTLVIMDDFLFENRGASKIKLGSGSVSYIWHGKIQSADSPQEKAMICEAQKLYPKLLIGNKCPKTGGKFLVVDTCGGYIKRVYGNAAAELIVLDENADNDRKIGNFAFGDSIRCLLYYGIVWGQALSAKNGRLLKKISTHIEKNQPGTLIGLPAFHVPDDRDLELPNIRKALHAEIAYRTIMKSEYADTFLSDGETTGVGDLLCDLMHFCDLNEDVPFEAVVRQAFLHYDAEIAQEKEFQKEEVTPESVGDFWERAWALENY